MKWEKVKLREICKDKDGLRRGPFGSAIKKEFFVPKGFKVYEQSNAIYDDAQRGNYFIDEKKYLELINFKVLPGDLIVSCSGTLGRIAELPFNAMPGVINQALLRIRLRDDLISKKYFLYHFRSAAFQKKIFDQSQGTAMANLIGIKDFKEVEIPLPSVEQQEEVISKIEELFSELDKGIEQLKTAQQQLKVYRQSVLKWAFEGRLTRSLNYDSYDLPVKHDLNVAAENEIGYIKKNALPRGWRITKISDLASVNPRLPNKESINENLEVQFIPMKLVEEVINKIHLTETKVFKEVQKGSYTPFVDGDVIFAKVTPCMENGKIAVAEKLKNGVGYGSSEFHVIRCCDKLLNKYVFYFLVRDKFRSEAESAMTGAVGLRRVPKQFIENYFIPFPEVEEQKQIVQEIESRLSVADKLEETINNSLRQAEALRQSILKKAFEGRLI